MARGTLRIYLGAAPGVGKTFAMLGEGLRRVGRGTDVVVGLVETHGRPRTAEQIGDLEVVPRRRLDYRGTSFEEMDVDAVLARRPAVALVDEYAHSNVPGSRNAKRWQDVEELLDAGIDVISTLNMQHLESVNDVVEQITGVKQRETIPDEIVRRADQIELVDMTPEALRRRLAHGNVYPAERIDAALGNYFRQGNLGALRELALLWVADRVDEALQSYRDRHGIDRPWETRERVLVGLTGSPDGDRLIRRASRMAARARADLMAVHVRTQDGLEADSDAALSRQRALVEELGGGYREFVGEDTGATLVSGARSLNATQIVLGASRRSRWKELTRGSVVNRVIRDSGVGIDVHVISLAADDEDERPLVPRGRRPSALPPRRQIVGLVLGGVLVVALGIVLSHLRHHLSLPSVLLLYLLAVVVVAAVGGLWAALATAVVSFLVVNWFFTPPLHAFTIGETENLLALFVFLAVATIVSGFVSLAARRAADGRRAHAEAQVLAALAGESTVQALLDRVRAAFGLDSVCLWRMDHAETTLVAVAGRSAASDEGERFEAGPSHVLIVNGGRIRPEDRPLLTAFGREVAASLHVAELEAGVSTVDSLAAANELRTALLSAVSHDLRTPLAGIKASVTSLLADDVAWGPEDTDAFLRAIDEDADRLDALVANLLDMSRLQTGALDVDTLPIGLEDVVPAALRSIGEPADRVVVDVPGDLPRVDADPGLLERALANVLANAIGHGGGAPVRLTAGPAGGMIDLRVCDRGPGVPPARPRGDVPAVPAARRRAVRRGDRSRPRGCARIRPGDGGRGRGRGHARRRAHGGTAPAGGVRMTRVLVVDDEPQMLRALSANLRARGYDVDLAATGEAALARAARDHPDLVLLDLGLPGMDGVEVVRGLRGWTDVPVIVVSARHEEASKVAALDAGADDYVTKPFGMDELLARLRAALRRSAPGPEEALVETESFTVDLAAKQVVRDGAPIRLTPTEWAILEILVRNPGRLVTQRQLLHQVWGPRYETETNYLRVYLGQIRAKLESDPARPRHFITEPRMGYRFVP